MDVIFSSSLFSLYFPRVIFPLKGKKHLIVSSVGRFAFSDCVCINVFLIHIYNLQALSSRVDGKFSVKESQHFWQI